MKIYDCFMYYNEDVILDIRLNYLDKFVDKFVIIESVYAHNGEKRKLHFKKKKFHKFAKKIIYIVLDKQPTELIEIDKIKEKFKDSAKILNAIKRENFHRNFILHGLKKAKKDDIIIISDVDEIPKLDNFNFKNVVDKIYIFQQKYFYYKLNLYNPLTKWHGSRLCKFSRLLSPQWIRNIKAKKYSRWRLDVYWSKKKLFNIELVKDGGWHFSYLKNAEGIIKKLKTYLHHVEYDLNPIGKKQIQKIINSQKAIYNLTLDKKNYSSRFSSGNKLKILDINNLPPYVFNNQIKFKHWLK
jgi:beta-1,4-mannosyl-glycoprotein beta-1,4-N-acetylglucosaminyltransferase